MFRIALCDDNPMDLQQLFHLLKNVLDSFLPEFEKCTVDCYSSALDLLKKTEEGVSYTLFLIDVIMDEMSGMELASALRGKGVDSDIVFTTSSVDFALNAFDVNAIDYLVKPVDEARLMRALRRCQKLNAAPECITLAVNKRNVLLARNDIFFVESFSHVCIFHTASRDINCYITMDAVMRLLGSGFVRCHKSYILNLKHVQRIQEGTVLLENGASVPLSRSMRTAFLDAYDAYLIHTVWEKRCHD